MTAFALPTPILLGVDVGTSDSKVQATKSPANRSRRYERRRSSPSRLGEAPAASWPATASGKEATGMSSPARQTFLAHEGPRRLDNLVQVIDGRARPYTEVTAR